MKKILLINSPIYDYKYSSDYENYLFPFGLGYIASDLLKHNIKVEIIDSVQFNLLSYELEKAINFRKPDFVGINIFSTNSHLVKTIIQKSNYPFIIGGHTVKHIYQDIINWNLENKLILVIGEADHIVTDIVLDKIKEPPIIKKGAATVYEVNHKSVYFPNDLSKINLNREEFNIQAYKNYFGLNEGHIITSRGCYYKCAFCGASRKYNKNLPIRTRNYNDILNEIQTIKSINDNVECIRILDDLFLKNENSINSAIKLFSEVKLKWRSMAHIMSFNGITIKKLHNLYTSGCVELFIGIESGSEKIRKMIRKSGNRTLIIKTVKNILSVGINIKGYFIFGFPEENLEDLEQTYSLAKALKDISLKSKGNFRVSVFQYRPYIGTELYYNIINKNKKIEKTTQNIELKTLKGRNQFNFESGNYSNCNKKDIVNYILKTMKLNEYF